MKKGKKREVTLEELQRRERIANRIQIKLLKLTIVIEIGMILIGIILALIIKDSKIVENTVVMKLFLSIVFSMILIAIIIENIEKHLQYQIEEKLEQEKISKIKEMAKKGDLKGALIPIVTDRKAVATMLVKNIESVICNLEGTSLMLGFNPKKDFTIFTFELPIEEWLKEETIELILDHYVDTIKIEDLQEGKMKVSILGEGFCYENEKVTDDDLLEMFKLKEDE